MLIPLICTQCGGKLDVEKSQVVEAGESVIVVNDQTFNCPHCNTKYLPGEKIGRAPVKAVISIGGSVTGSNIIVGNGMVFNKNPTPVSPQSKRTRWILAGLILLVVVLCAVMIVLQQ